MHLIKNSNCVKTASKEVCEAIFKTILSSENNARLSWSVEKVPGYMCYRFELFISMREATGKMTHQYKINHV